MNVITDIGSELALAFLVEKKHSKKIAMREALRIIGRVQAELENVADEDEAADLPSEKKFDFRATN